MLLYIVSGDKCNSTVTEFIINIIVLLCYNKYES